ELLRTIAESARQLTGAQFGSFWLADERTRTLVYTAGSVPQIGRDSSQLRASYDVGLIGWVARHRESLVIDDVFADSSAMNNAWWRTWVFQSFAGYPVVVDDELLAILALCHSQPVSVTSSMRDVIDLFLAQASVAVRNARLYAESQRERRE